ncbi:MAG: class I mannose-6-phosphate isomerase [Paludibacteraceae bacterium]|nr:mannose-6-phosphate isomerase [Bacteroidales bacterium]MBO5132763.1 class I mannose-6-phosphate isomerase [Paludibacteraceae bacterium]MBQ9100574.1 class I mannose-6-phosphate isomerase [Paludibacteraceae bacterium]MBR6660055.1 class I mannose-6-phosphate isomerase [Paludibacteraceae bacterium]
MREVLYPLLFEENLQERVWGAGNRLREFKGMPIVENDKIGESWEISAVEGKCSVVSNGPLKGKTLCELVDEYGDLLMGKVVTNLYGNQFPLLIKFIDAAQDLSIQVHPDDNLAKERHNSFGKTELWYVMDAVENAKLYCGFDSPISKYEYEKRVEDKSICSVLKQYQISKGDVFYIPAGRVHAICGGTLIAEVQQSSDLTYRIYDYDRAGLDGKPRDLHTELAKDAIDYQVLDNYKTDYNKKLNKPVCISSTQFFTVKLLEVDRAFHRKLYKYDSFIIYMCLEGDCEIAVRSTSGYGYGVKPPVERIFLKKGNSCLIPASVADFDVVPSNKNKETKLLEVYIDNKNFNRE